MSTSMMRSVPAATPSKVNAVSARRGLMQRLADGSRRVRRLMATILFGAAATRLMDTRDVDSYLRTTEG